MSTAEAAPSLGEEREALEDRLRRDLHQTLARHGHGGALTHAGFLPELVAVIHGYADAKRSLALDSVAGSLAELVTLARKHLGEAAPAAKRPAAKAGS